MIGIIDYGIGNVASIFNILKKIGCEPACVSNPADVRKADKLILPGVGAFDTGMMLLTESGMVDEINDSVLRRRIPLLGICLGMQMLGKSSEEGNMEGLGYIDMKSVRLNPVCSGGDKIKVPHMGWDYVNITGGSKLLVGMENGKERYYFVHSYYAVCNNHADVQMTCRYGETFAVAICHDNIYGVQFHPEKSHKFGMNLLKNYANL